MAGGVVSVKASWISYLIGNPRNLLTEVIHTPSSDSEHDRPMKPQKKKRKKEPVKSSSKKNKEKKKKFMLFKRKSKKKLQRNGQETGLLDSEEIQRDGVKETVTASGNGRSEHGQNEPITDVEVGYVSVEPYGQRSENGFMDEKANQEVKIKKDLHLGPEHRSREVAVDGKARSRDFNAENRVRELQINGREKARTIDPRNESRIREFPVNAREKARTSDPRTESRVREFPLDAREKARSRDSFFGIVRTPVESQSGETELNYDIHVGQDSVHQDGLYKSETPGQYFEHDQPKKSRVNVANNFGHSEFKNVKGPGVQEQSRVVPFNYPSNGSLQNTAKLGYQQVGMQHNNAEFIRSRSKPNNQYMSVVPDKPSSVKKQQLTNGHVNRGSRQHYKSEPSRDLFHVSDTNAHWGSPKSQGSASDSNFSLDRSTKSLQGYCTDRSGYATEMLSMDESTGVSDADSLRYHDEPRRGRRREVRGLKKQGSVGIVLTNKDGDVSSAKYYDETSEDNGSGFKMEQAYIINYAPRTESPFDEKGHVMPGTGQSVSGTVKQYSKDSETTGEDGQRGTRGRGRLHRLGSKRGKAYCQKCKKKCSGEVLRVQDNYYHIECFKCKECRCSLASGGFFTKDGEYYCSKDYQDRFGTKCGRCGDYVEGEVVTALGATYHQTCFTCARCRQPFPAGERVTYTGKEYLCQKCVHIPVVESKTPEQSPGSCRPECAGCQEELKEGQALIALDKQWHIWCFKCHTCSAMLHGEYMGKDGKPYCEKDYQAQFGVKCAYCSRFISGKVLQAGDNHHFHPTCARCTKCGDPFGDGEEMYLQGAAIWHPRCGPGPSENGTIISTGIPNGSIHVNHAKEDGLSSTASETQLFRSRTPSLNGSFRSTDTGHSFSRKYGSMRTSSPGLILREYPRDHPDDITRIYTYSYLTTEPSMGYLKRPIHPYDKPPRSPQFHRPPPDSTGSTRKHSWGKAQAKTAMKALVDSIQTESPRPRSPHMNNEEPIELAHYPDGARPNPKQPPRIERDDFPAPPFPYTDPERRRRWSGSYKSIPESEEDDLEDMVDVPDSARSEDPKLKREEEELTKIASGIGKVFLQQVKEREKIKHWKATHLDPRKASRVPSAAHESVHKLRYDSPINASPSRDLTHARPWDDGETDFDRGSSLRSSTGRSVPTVTTYNVVSSLRCAPKPGYCLRANTLPVPGRSGGGQLSWDGEYPFTGLGREKSQSGEFSSGKSDVSAGSLTDTERGRVSAELRSSTTYSSGLTQTGGYSAHLRQSLPNMVSMADPPKIYPIHLLMTSNYRLPADVDRMNLERHLSDSDFEVIFQLPRVDFYRLPEWKRNDLKKRSRLF